MPLPAIQAQSLPEIRLNEREQVQYLLGNPPSWMMRYGIATMAAFFAVLLSLSYLVRYPDIAEAPVVLVTTNPAIRMLAKNSGRISELFVKEQQSVKAGQLLAIFESPVAWRDVNRLEKWLSTAKPDDDLLSSTLQLGSLQEAYSVFSQHWKECQYFTRHNGVSAKISFLKQQIEQLKAINTNLDKQTAILREEYTLAGKEIVRQNQLHHSQLIADDELEKAEVVYLQHKRQLGAPEAAALQNQMQIRQLESQINDLLQAKSDNSVSQKLTLEEDLLRLQSAIEAWKQNYLIHAPIDGKISLSKIWSVQQSIGVGEEIMAVVPFSIQGTEPYTTGNTAQEIIGKATLSAYNAGKVHAGMRAIIRLEGFPPQEYGTLEATVVRMALLPQKEAYLIDLSLSDSLITSCGKKLEFRQEMSGQVRIIMEDRRVLSRIFGQLRDLLQNS
jgi:multidrug resistance efflux pump